MDKELILAVAGSGKTSLIVDKLDLIEKYLVITYTINNTANLRYSIIEKFGYFPENIFLFSYFNFLYSFCFMPYLGYKLKPKGIYWKIPPRFTNKIPLNNINRFMTNEKLLYHNRIAKLIEHNDLYEELNHRLEKYFDYLYIDEVQDFAGHDFNLLKNIIKSDLNVLLVGDFYQHTFDTSRDGNTNAKIHVDYESYKKIFEDCGLKTNIEHLDKSYRCSSEVCKFISSQLGIVIESNKEENSKVVFIEEKTKIEDIFRDKKIRKLFYQESNKYPCFARNWGDSKGESYDDICVVLNQTASKLFKKGKLYELPPVSRNKLYVACSRTKNNLYLILENKIKHLKQKS